MQQKCWLPRSGNVAHNNSAMHTVLEQRLPSSAPKIISPEGNLCIKRDPSLVPVADFDRHACWLLLLLLGTHMPGQLGAAEPAVQID